MKISISIVSHHSGRFIGSLLSDLVAYPAADMEIILTLNVPEDESYLHQAGSLPLIVIRNAASQGFGANHNQAFAASSGERFVVLNPDVRLLDSPWQALHAAIDRDTGASAPLVISPSGEVEDSVRRYPTMSRLFRRAVLRDRRPDYLPCQERKVQDVEWVGGMFIMFDSACYKMINGFDTRYFMYLEDADICRRLHAHGKKVHLVPACRVVHDAQRASRKSFRHLRWHLTSFVKFFLRYS